MIAAAWAPATLRWWAWCGLAFAASISPPAVAATTGDKPDPESTAATCQRLVPVPWPATLVERRQYLRRMETSREACIGHAPYLAALGALWLEDGDAEQARIWLERSLMLDPDSYGAQADHALALAALGEPTALQELARAWRQREDLPYALRQRILSALDPQYATRLPSIRLGGPLEPNRASRGEASVLLGYESNLNVAPRLTELTLTFPGEDPITLPVISSLRQGGAAKVDVAWQTAWELSPRRVVRSGMGLAARSAPGESSTDWHQWQAGASFTQKWNGWSATVQADLARFGGRLTEPYSTLRTQFALEQVLENCTHGSQVGYDVRRQSQTESADSQITSLGWRLQCRPASLRHWQFGLGLRTSIDRPRLDTRPGDTQRSNLLTLRTGYRPTPLLGIDITLGALKSRDTTIYSEFLEGKPIRRQTLKFGALELSHALYWAGMPGVEAILQVTRFVQDSNLSLFRNDGVTAYAGLRWPW